MRPDKLTRPPTSSHAAKALFSCAQVDSREVTSKIWSARGTWEKQSAPKWRSIARHVSAAEKLVPKSWVWGSGFYQQPNLHRFECAARCVFFSIFWTHFRMASHFRLFSSCNFSTMDFTCKAGRCAYIIWIHTYKNISIVQITITVYTLYIFILLSWK